MLSFNMLEITGWIALIFTFVLSVISVFAIGKFMKTFKKVFKIMGGGNPIQFALNKRRKQ